MIKRAQLSNLTWLLLSIAVIALDQYSKHLAFTRLVFAEPYAVTSFFNLTLLYNTGAAFSFMHGSAGWQQGLFSVIAVVISIALLIWLYRLPNNQWRMCMALSLILGGAPEYGTKVGFLQVYYAPLTHTTLQCFETLGRHPQ